MKKIKTDIGISPLKDKVVIKPLSKEEVSPSGIIIPDTVDKEKPEQGTVVAVGPGKDDEKMTVKEGDNVMFSKHGFDRDEVKIDGEEYYILSESSILAVIK